MILMNNFIRIMLSIIFVTFLSSCQTTKTLNDGIQAGYEAINPASIIAIPIFTIPDPSRAATVDPAIIHTNQFIAKLQEKIMEAFKDQPNINGYSFNAVNNILAKSNPDIWKNMENSLIKIASRFHSRDAVIRSTITSSCLSRKNFLEFYSFCAATDTVWISQLNQLALRVLNADTALIVVLKNLNSAAKNDLYTLNAGISILLVDTNNAKLIWGKDKNISIMNAPEKKYFPTAEELLKAIFTDDFWDGFPGRSLKVKPKI